MKLVRYGQAAMIAAIMVLSGNAVRAQQASGQYGTPQAIYFGTMKPDCCKDGKCSKEGECCSQTKKCDAKCSCCKDSKCACCKDGECGCDKNGKCSCGKDKTVSTTGAGDCCPFLSKLAKKTAIILVMPASMPLPACCMEAMGMMPHPPMPAGPHVWMPAMMPPIPPIPPTPSMGIGMPVMPPMPTSYGCAPPAYAPCPDGNTVWAAGPASYVQCSTTTPTTAAKVCISAASSRDQLEMDISDETSIRCKKMTIKIGESEITVSRFDDRVRIRGEDFKATANCVHSDRKERLILEGDVVLHYKKDGHIANLIADRVELNLSSSAMTIQKTAHYGE